MPKYEYKCMACLSVFDKNVSVNERNMVKCVCGEVAKRKLSNVIVQYKGEGFTGAVSDPTIFRPSHSLANQLNRHG